MWCRTERNDCQLHNLVLAHRNFDRLPPSCHDVTLQSIKPKRGIHEQTTRFMSSFMESVV